MAKSLDLPGVPAPAVDPVVKAAMDRQVAALSKTLDSVRVELSNLMASSEAVRSAMRSRIVYLQGRERVTSRSLADVRAIYEAL